VDEFLAPKIDIEKSMKFKQIKYKDSPGPKQDWDCNFIQRTMIGDESGLREAVKIKEQNKLKKRIKIANVDTGLMKISKEQEIMLNSIIKPGILDQVVPSIGANTMKGAGGLTSMSDASGASKISTSSSQFSKM
jgi:hypothetical protein